MFWIIFITSGIYVIYAVILASFLQRESVPPADNLTVSLIIPARNEESSILRVLESMEALDYPRDRLQVVLVNHNSRDRTPDLMREFAAKSKYRVEIVDCFDAEGEIPCKTKPLRAGVDIADGEILAFTDAEAKFSPSWLKSMVGGIRNGSDMVGGAIEIEGEGGFAVMQRYDWLFIFTVGAGFAGMKRPQSIFGKNLVIRREFYDNCGGFPKGFAWTEDLELMNHCRGKGKIKMTLDKNCAVSSLPAEGIRSFFRQKLRWFRGGAKIDLPGLLALAIAAAMDLGLLASMFCGLRFFLPVYALKLFSDWLILHIPIRDYPLKNYKIELPLYSLFSPFYHAVLLFYWVSTDRLKWR